MKAPFKLGLSIFLFAFTFTVVVLGGVTIPPSILNKLPQLSTVFISIIIQALPFVLIAVFASALMQKLITVEMIEQKLAKTGRLPGILMAIGAGFLFPVCDCGVIPVARRLLLKKVPPYMAIAFMVTAPLVNPITVWATATAFGYSLSVTLIRLGMAIGIGIIVAWLVSEFLPNLSDILNQPTLAAMESAAAAAEPEAHSCSCGCGHSHEHHGPRRQSVIGAVFEHANEEFLEVGKFLIIGAFLAATIQVALPKTALLALTQNPALSILTMMLLALSLSLCAEADAFVARSFTYHFPLGSVMAFMVFGQMLDIKNTLLLVKSFRPKALVFIFGCCAVLVFLLCLLLNLSGAGRFFQGRF
ncbi:hypothetical protein EDC14_101326 [Hydrogenispora ethanolica]|uniref:Permease n=1 Tax=Hydrogenispora ethanolica TaxID=1082276 RepID=A0A4R1RQB1_HYDET|nr:permease [Hydrogenispora ethanolica]TCL68486.1 hypothetical protein EDC14_101326 [Hydrogenispora ethanolica]